MLCTQRYVPQWSLIQHFIKIKFNIINDNTISTLKYSIYNKIDTEEISYLLNFKNLSNNNKYLYLHQKYLINYDVRSMQYFTYILLEIHQNKNIIHILRLKLLSQKIQTGCGHDIASVLLVIYTPPPPLKIRKLQ